MRFEDDARTAPPSVHPTAPYEEEAAAPARSIVVVLAYLIGAWTLGYWAALALGRGWAVALAVGALALVLSALVGRPWVGTSGRDVDGAGRSDLPAVVLVLGVVLAWPLLLDVPRSLLWAAAAGFALVRLALVRSRRWSVIGGAVAGVALLAGAAAAVGWGGFVVVVLLLALSLILRPSWPAALAARFEDHTDRGGIDRRWLPAGAETLVLLALGSLVAVWHIGVPFWNPDNTYYLNKAIHYGQSPSAFSTDDLMYGVSGVQHVPYGNQLSSYEPLLGVLGRGSRLSVTDLTFGLVAPGLLLLLPFAARYAARGLGIARSGLVGALAPAAILLMSSSDTTALFAQASLGKDLGRLVLVPILLGAVGHHVRAPSRRTAMTSSLAAVATVGMSPSLGIAAGVILAPFVIGGAVTAWRARPADRPPARTGLLLAAPLLVTGGFVLFAAVFQAASDQVQIGFRAFDAPEAAWEFATGLRLETSTLAGLVVVCGSAAGFGILLGSDALRRGAGLYLALLVGVLFSPWTFDLVLGDILDLNHFAWRILWAMPFATLIGFVGANVDRDRAAGLLTLVPVLLVIGLSGPEPIDFLRPAAVDVTEAPVRWPWESGFPADLDASASAVIRATPVGGRFLAPEPVEEIATAVQIDRTPVYARLSYVETVLADPSTPRAFFAQDRYQLGLAVNGRDAVGDVSAAEWSAALDRVDVSTICLGPEVSASFREAVESLYEQVAPAARCTVWARGG